MLWAVAERESQPAIWAIQTGMKTERHQEDAQRFGISFSLLGFHVSFEAQEHLNKIFHSFINHY
jgi:hypothetical protein